MTVAVIISHKLLSFEEGEGRIEWQDATDYFHNCLHSTLDERDVPASVATVHEDDYYPLADFILREDVADWLQDNGIEPLVSVAFHLDDADHAMYHTHKDPMHRSREMVYFSPLVKAEFTDSNAAMLFKLTWGGQ